MKNIGTDTQAQVSKCLNLVLKKQYRLGTNVDTKNYMNSFISVSP